MINIFSRKSTASILLLFIIALAIRIPLLFNPPNLYININDGLLSLWIKKYINFSSISVQYISLIIAYFLTVIQALRLNYIVNNQRLYLQYNYLPALGYIVILNLLPGAQTLSIPLLLNIGLINILSSLLQLYNHPNPKALIYNIGLLLGVMMLLYTPTYLYIILVFLIMFIMRPFQIAEWLILLLGLLTPYYFWYGYLFLTDQWNFWLYLPKIALHNPLLHINKYNSIAFVFLLILLVVGFMYWQKNNRHMVIQVRKSWTVFIWGLLLSLCIPFTYKYADGSSFILCVPMVAVIVSNAALYSSKKIIASILSWLLLFYGIFICYINSR